MARFKVGDKIIDWFGRKASIIDEQRFTVNLTNDKKHTFIKYLVKWDSPTPSDTWAMMDADRMIKIPKSPKQPKAVYHVSSLDADSGNKIILAIRIVGGKLAYVGFSVCHEDDNFSYDVGEELAKFRAKKHPYKYFFNRKGIEENINAIQNECMEELKKNWKIHKEI